VNHRLALHRRIREHVKVVAACGRELRDDRTLVTGAEPVQRVRRDRPLIARFEDALVFAMTQSVTLPRRQRNVSSLPGVPSNGG
jgi:hypothetical protein